MRLGIIGQCQGGNAVLWFELFNNHRDEYEEIQDLTYICRNENELEGNFNITELYGKKRKGSSKYISLISRLFRSRISNKFYFKFIFPKKRFDVVHIQGNYSPSFNLQVIQNTKAKIVLQIMGSDFYQNYINEKISKKERLQFIQVLRQVDRIVCSRESSKKDLLKHFPFISKKLSVIRLGTSKKWLDVPLKSSKPKSSSQQPTVFLSTRGLYDYNNVQLLVEAFCTVYKNKKDKALLQIINGYGNHESVIKKGSKLGEEHACSDIVELVINNWVSEERLMDYYRQADYNFCIGSTDQLSVSITYGLITCTPNILSPIDTYFELRDSGYKSLFILNEVSLSSLIEFFEKPPAPDFKQLNSDREKASKEHIATENFKKFINVYKAALSL